MGFMSVHLKMPSQIDSTVDGLDGWKYLGGVRYRTPYGANNICIVDGNVIKSIMGTI